MIVDSVDNVIEFWPIFLVDGENSEDLFFTIDNPSGPTAVLTATYNAETKVWAKQMSDMSYVEISSTPYDLSGVAAGPVDFVMHVECISVTSFDRVPLSVIVGSGSPAGWKV